MHRDVERKHFRKNVDIPEKPCLIILFYFRERWSLVIFISRENFCRKATIFVPNSTCKSIWKLRERLIRTPFRALFAGKYKWGGDPAVYFIELHCNVSKDKQTRQTQQCIQCTCSTHPQPLNHRFYTVKKNQKIINNNYGFYKNSQI